MWWTTSSVESLPSGRRTRSDLLQEMLDEAWMFGDPMFLSYFSWTLLQPGKSLFDWKIQVFWKDTHDFYMGCFFETDFLSTSIPVDETMRNTEWNPLLKNTVELTSWIDPLRNLKMKRMTMRRPLPHLRSHLIHLRGNGRGSTLRTPPKVSAKPDSRILRTWKPFRLDQFWAGLQLQPQLYIKCIVKISCNLMQLLELCQFFDAWWCGLGGSKCWHLWQRVVYRYQRSVERLSGFCSWTVL